MKDVQAKGVKQRPPTRVVLVGVRMAEELGVEQAVHGERRVFVKLPGVDVLNDDESTADAHGFADDGFGIGRVVQDGNQQTDIEVVVAKRHGPAVVKRRRDTIDEAEVFDIERRYIETAVAEYFDDVAGPTANVEDGFVRLNQPDEAIDQFRAADRPGPVDEPAKRSRALANFRKQGDPSGLFKR